MIRWALLAAAAIALASCAQPEDPVVSASPGVCRIGPDGGPVVSDRGIGGTGGPGRTADRGIGGTGIVGVITGFASICVDGLEVAIDPDTEVDIDGAVATPEALRVGQMVAIRADGPLGALRARGVSVRHEVSGPVQAVEVGTDALYVAGQRVVVPADAWGRGSVRPGDWARISGLRAADGSVIATRIEVAEPGTVRLIGPLRQVDGTWRIGDVAVGAQPRGKLMPGGYVVATGRLDGNTLHDADVVPDLMTADPPAFFRGANRLVLQTGVRRANGVAALDGGFQVPIGPRTPHFDQRRAGDVLWLDRVPGGGFVTVPAPVPAPASAPASAPAASFPAPPPWLGPATPALPGAGMARPPFRPAPGPAMPGPRPRG